MMQNHTALSRTTLAAVLLLFTAWGATGSATAQATTGHHRPVEAVALSPDGRTLVSGGHDAVILVRDAASGQLRHRLEGHPVRVSSLAFSRDGSRLVSAGWDGTAVIWDLDEGKPIHRLTGHEDLLHAAAISPDGQRVATCGNDKTVRLWDAGSGQLRQVHPFVEPVPAALAFSPDGRTLAVGTRANTAVLLDVARWRPTATLDTGGEVHQLRFTPDGKRLLVGRSGRIDAWHVAKRERGEPYTVKGRSRGDFDLTPDGQRLAAASDRQVTVWATGEPGEPAATWDMKDATAVAIAPDGQRIVAGRVDGGLTVWNMAEDQPAYTIDPGDLPDLPTGPDQPVAAMLGVDLLAPASRDRWRTVVPTGALQWADQTQEAGAGLRFAAAAIPTHLVGDDRLTVSTGIGDRPFDLTCDVMIDQAGGPHFFTNGLAVGISSAPVDRMGQGGLAAVFAIHLDGIFAGATRGEPYRLRPDYNTDHNPFYRLGSDGRKHVVSWDRAARGTFTLDKPIRLNIRRDAKDRLRFTLWVPSAGHSFVEPWRRGSVQLPEDLADMPLEHLFVKRVNIGAEHLGRQATGYGEALRVHGRLANMTLRLDPPRIDELAADDHAVLAPGDALRITGAGLAPDLAVLIGDRPAPALEPGDGGQVRVRIPDLEPGRRYDLTVRQPASGLADTRSGVVAVGRFLESASLIEADPAGGQRVVVRGGGLDAQTDVRVGGRPAQVLEAGPEALTIELPAGAAGAAPITAHRDGSPLPGRIDFAYARRPSVWFTRSELEAWRQRSLQPPFSAYRERLLALADSSLRVKPSRQHGAQNSAGPLVWAYLLTGEPSYRRGVIAWMTFFVKQEPRFGQWHYREAALTALAYELLADDLDPDLRSEVQRFLLQALDHYVEHDMPGSWFAANPTSTNPMINHAAVSLALMFEPLRDDTDRVIDAARGHLTHYLETAISPDGAWTEGMHWAGDGLTDYLDVAHLLARHRDDRSLLGPDRLAHARRMYEQLLVGPGTMMTYGNMHAGLKGAAVAAYLDADDPDPLLRWVADQSVRGAGKADAWMLGRAMMWRSQAPAAQTPPALPTLARLADVQWVTMRSHDQLEAPLMVGLKGIQHGPQPYHQHTDAGSLTVFAHGQPLVVDPAWGQSRADQHTLPLIEGRGPDRWGAAVTDTWSDGPWRAAVVDATDAYHWSSDARRVRRTVVMHRDGVVLVLDDIVPGPDRPGQVSWKLQTLAASLPEAARVQVVSERASMSARWFGPTVRTAMQKHKKRFTEQHWHTVTADYDADPDRPLLTVLRTAGGDEAPPIETQVRYEGKRITADLGQRGVVRFERSDDGWGLALPKGSDKPLLLTPQPLPTKPRVTAVRAQPPPTLDGKLDEAIWQQAQPATGFKPSPTWGDDDCVRFPTEVRFAWDQDHLYMAVRAYEPDLEGIVSTLQGPAQSLADDDHLQLYLDPGREHAGNRYFGYHFPASGMHMGLYGKMGDVGRADMTIEAGRETGERSAWTLEVALPWSSLLHDDWRKLTVKQPEPGLAMSLNLRRYRMQTPEEISTWSRSEPSPTAVPWRWGTLVLE